MSYNKSDKAMPKYDIQFCVVSFTKNIISLCFSFCFFLFMPPKKKMIDKSKIASLYKIVLHTFGKLMSIIKYCYFGTSREGNHRQPLILKVVITCTNIMNIHF